MKRSLFFAALLLALQPALPARAADEGGTLNAPGVLGLQAGIIGQRMQPFHSPYEGQNSLSGAGQSALTQSYLLSLGTKLEAGWQVYADLRWQRGLGINGGNGLAGFANGDYAEGAHHSAPYLYRAFVRKVLAQGSRTHHVEKGLTRLEDEEPIDRIEIKLGRMLPSDDFDRNRYMSNPLSQFMNLGLVNNPGWDFAQDARGTTDGAVLGLHREKWSLMLGTYRMPEAPAGSTLEPRFAARNDNIELVLRTEQEGPTLRLLAYQNRARLGDYGAALRQAGAGAPDLATTRSGWRFKRGVGVSVELPLAHDGETGLFACSSWNDGKTEDFSFTEADSNLCAGLQLSGRIWARAQDRLGIGFLANAISDLHREYLARGGTGIQVGDGGLRYGTEQVLDVYYAVKLSRRFTLSPDLQYVRNPGYNRDRGPVVFGSVRLTVTF